MVGACQVGRAVACAGVGWKTACRDSQGAGGVVEVDVADVVGVAAAAVVVGDVAAGGAGRMDTCWDSSVGRLRNSADLACKTGQDRWNIQRQKQIAVESASTSGMIESVSGSETATATATAKGDGRGRNGPERGGLACRRRRRMEVAVVVAEKRARCALESEARSEARSEASSETSRCSGEED